MTKVTVNAPKPVPLPPTTVTIELSLKEAQQLRALLARTNASFFNDLYRLLDDQDVINGLELIGVPMIDIAKGFREAA